MPNFVGGNSGSNYSHDKTKHETTEEKSNSQTFQQQQRLITGPSTTSAGSFDAGDPTTTNLYIGNVHPNVKEDDLCDLFIGFGPLASVKIMWPRKEEERARNRNSGFVAFMNRADAEQAIRAVNGYVLAGYELRLGWAKAVAIPPNPIVYNPRINSDGLTMKPLFGNQFASQFAINNTSHQNRDPADNMSRDRRDLLISLLDNLDTSRQKVGDAMVFCIKHSNGAKEIVEIIYQSLTKLTTPLTQKLARLYLISDILHNCSASVTNASQYRQGFLEKLEPLFEHFHEYMTSQLDTNQKRNRLKQKVLAILGAWKEWTLYDDDFVIKLSDILLGTRKRHRVTPNTSVTSEPTACPDIEHKSGSRSSIGLSECNVASGEDSLDGEPIGEEMLTKCLEAKGLSLRWYKALNLSSDDLSEVRAKLELNMEKNQGDVKSISTEKLPKTGDSQKVDDRIKFKASKWEIVDPRDVHSQAVTLSKWENLSKCENPSQSDLNKTDIDSSDQGVAQ